jgi:acyl-coenzyme A synthetase/AMP-(fatty) acid ligase
MPTASLCPLCLTVSPPRSLAPSAGATEHGGIVWSRCFGNTDQPLLPNTRTWPLPWISAAVLVRVEDDTAFLLAEEGEQGECVISRRYPYQGLTVWHSDGFGSDA